MIKTHARTRSASNTLASLTSARSLAGMALIALAGLAGCASSGNSATSAPASPQASASQSSEIVFDLDGWRDLGYRLAWSVSGEASTQEGVKFIDPLGDLILIHSNDNILTAREATTGVTRWSRQVGRPIVRFVGTLRDGDTIYSCEESQLHYINAQSGNLERREPFAALANTKPTLYGPLMLISGTGGQVVAHNTNTGVYQWRYRMGSPITAAPVMVGRDVAVVTDSGEVLLIDVVDRDSRGRGRNIYGGLANTPVTDGRRLYIASLDQSIYCFDSSDGAQRWRIRTEAQISAQPALHEGVLYVEVPTEGAGMIAVNTNNGAIIWNNADLSGEVIGSVKGDLMVWDGETMHTVDAADGSVIKSVPLPGTDHIRTTSFADGDLYVSMSDGSIGALRRR